MNPSEEIPTKQLSALEIARAEKRRKQKEASEKSNAGTAGSKKKKKNKPAGPKETPQIVAAMRVVKGALVKVTKGRIKSGGTTLRSTYKQNKGELQVECSEDLSSSEVKALKEECHFKVNDDAPIHYFTMDRAEAESKFGTEFYDKMAPPAEVKSLTLVYIHGWALSCSLPAPFPEPVNFTSEIGRLTIGNTKFNKKNQKLTIKFSVEPVELSSRSRKELDISSISKEEVDAIHDGSEVS
eukprot:g972.t1